MKSAKKSYLANSLELNRNPLNKRGSLHNLSDFIALHKLSIKRLEDGRPVTFTATQIVYEKSIDSRKKALIGHCKQFYESCKIFNNKY